MQNGNGISELIGKLYSIDEQWELSLTDEKRSGGEQSDRGIGRLINALRQEMKEKEADEVKKYLRQMQLREETVEILIKRAENILRLYREFSVLRELENRDAAALRGMLSIIYQKYIVRFEPKYITHMATEKYNEEVLINVANRIGNLTDFYVSRSYTVQGMVKDLRDETGLSQVNCEYWADLIEQNYLALKLNYIIEELNGIKRSLPEVE